MLTTFIVLSFCISLKLLLGSACRPLQTANHNAPFIAAFTEPYFLLLLTSILFAKLNSPAKR